LSAGPVDAGEDAAASACANCVTAARAVCCATEQRALDDCAERTSIGDSGVACPGGTDCVAFRCSVEVRTLNACLAAGRGGFGVAGMTCQAALVHCFGTWPVNCRGDFDSGVGDDAAAEN